MVRVTSPYHSVVVLEVGLGQKTTFVKSLCLVSTAFLLCFVSVVDKEDLVKAANSTVLNNCLTHSVLNNGCSVRNTVVIDLTIYCNKRNTILSSGSHVWQHLALW